MSFVLDLCLFGILYDSFDRVFVAYFIWKCLIDTHTREIKESRINGEYAEVDICLEQWKFYAIYLCEIIHIWFEKIYKSSSNNTNYSILRKCGKIIAKFTRRANNRNKMKQIHSIGVYSCICEQEYWNKNSNLKNSTHNE